MDDSGTDSTAPMTAKQAVTWLRQVDGELFRTPPGRGSRDAWVAVVRSPLSDAKPRTIVALGETLEEAASAAASQWRELFRGVGPLH